MNWLNTTLWVMVVIIVVGAAWETFAHDWYEPACCSGYDCKPVHDSDVVEKPDGVHVRNWGVLSRSDPRIRTSRDDASHICEITTGLPYNHKLYCVYLKPSGT